MESLALPSSTVVVVQPQLSELNVKSNRLVFRLGWITFILGACAFLIHYISLDHLANFSPFNAGLISGFFLMIAGLASIAAGYQETSHRHHVHAQLWSFLVDLILAPGLIAVSIAALITDSQDIHPVCQPTELSARTLPLGNSLEIYTPNELCIKVTSLFDLTRILNILQLIIGLICFVIHIILISNQKKIIKQMKINKLAAPKEMIVYTQPTSTTMGQHPCYADPPPKYEDLALPSTIGQ